MRLAHVHDKHKAAREAGQRGVGSRWEVWSNEPDPLTGKDVARRRRFVKRKDADAYCEALNKKLREGISAPTADGSITVAEVFDQWLPSRQRIAASTRTRLIDEMRRWVLPRFGPRSLRSIRRQDVQVFVNDLLVAAATPRYVDGVVRDPQPLSPASVRHIVGQLRGIYKFALANGLYSGQNPVAGTELPRIVRKEMVFLDFRQIEELLRLIGARPNGKKNAAMVELMAFTGLRIGEALTLRGRDVDLVRREIRVRSSWKRDGYKWVIGLPKGEKTRTVPISERIATTLEPWVKAADDLGFVFAAVRGGPQQEDNWRSRVWTPAIRGTKFEAMGMRPHDLRHTAASVLINNTGTSNVKAIQSILGHASATETLDRYGHLWPSTFAPLVLDVEAARSAALDRSEDPS